LEAGIDVILGNHSHTLQSAEQYVFTDQATGREKKGLILYAMGDMASGCPSVPNSSLAAVARIGIQKGTVNGQSVTLVNNVDFKPLYRYTEFQGKRCIDYRLLDIKRLADEITQDACTLPLTQKQKKEVIRLRALAGRVMPFAYRKN
jgi:poly-gamma-glutamate capsule biosynthesis protein CapA/YwtB (metallophosphatase superfamily)